MLHILVSTLLIILYTYALITLTSKYRINPFFILLPAALLCGLCTGISPVDVPVLVKKGFGTAVSNTGLIIVLGHLLISILIRTGSFTGVYSLLIKIKGDKKLSVAAGAVAGILSALIQPEAGLILFSPAGKYTAEKSGRSIKRESVFMSCCIYFTGCLVIPAVVCSGIFNANTGLVLLLVIVMFIPALFLFRYFTARFSTEHGVDENIYENQDKPGVGKTNWRIAVISVGMPVVLMSVKALSMFHMSPLGKGKIFRTAIFLGDPAVSLLAGIIAALVLCRRYKVDIDFTEISSKSLKNSLYILALAGAAGALGSVFNISPSDKIITGFIPKWSVIILPFVTAFIFKIFQGSSARAIISSASLTTTCIHSAGLCPELAVLAAGIGAMTVSHVNDPYFWVVAKFSKLSVKETYSNFTVPVFITGIFIMLGLTILNAIMVI